MINGIRIRLARHGMRGAPVYHIVAIPAGKPREARPLEKLGEYDPVPRVPNTDFIPPPNRIFGKEHVEPPKEKKISWDVGRIKYWLSQGAKPTGRVVKLLAKGRILDEAKYTSRVAREIRPRLEAEATPPAIIKVQARRKHRDEFSKLLLKEAAERDAEKRGSRKEAEGVETAAAGESSMSVGAEGAKKGEAEVDRGRAKKSNPPKRRDPRQAAQVIEEPVASIKDAQPESPLQATTASPAASETSQDTSGEIDVKASARKLRRKERRGAEEKDAAVSGSER